MSSKKGICLLNDSFPPLIDGVANTVLNYARVLEENNYDVSVVTPKYPGADDSSYDYPVLRYPSIDLSEIVGYSAGNPFSLQIQKAVMKQNVSLLHSHCPVMSNILARQLRDALKVPFIMTYHTKFDIDIANMIKIEPVQDLAVRTLIESISAVDELWVVSEGAGKNVRSLGYQGDYIVMPNGVDISRGTSSYTSVKIATSGYNLPDNVPVFLFVGRLMWYKGIRIILDALAALKSQNFDFRMVFVGSGGDEREIRSYTSSLMLDDKVYFTGAIRDRDTLRAWYTKASLFLFPSTFDTSGLVVKEAAACSLASVLIKDSCASEGVTDRVDGLLIDENAASLAVCLATVISKPEFMHQLGENACRNLYYSWDDSIHNAMSRYDIVIENYNCGYYTKHRTLVDEAFSLRGTMLNSLEKLDREQRHIQKVFEDFLEKYRLSE